MKPVETPHSWRCMPLARHALVGCGTLLLATSFAGAQPDVLPQVAFDQRLNEQVPEELMFRDHTGQPVALREYFGDKPIVLSLVYFECPMLCTLELNGLVRSLKTLPLTAGRDFTLLTVSFDPGETPALAARKRRIYLDQYGRPGTDWHFLTGDETNTRRLCDAVGFRYAYDAERDEYAHASGIVVLTPQGRIARYFYGIDYPPRDLRLGLVEASDGEIGSVANQLLLLCYGYDPATGRYGFLIMNAIRLGGAATVFALGAFIGVALYRDRRTKRAAESSTAAVPQLSNPTSTPGSEIQ